LTLSASPGGGAAQVLLVAGIADSEVMTRAVLRGAALASLPAV